MKSIRNARLIINPISGTASKEGLSERLCDELASRGFVVEPAMTQAPGHATELARDAANRGFDAVFACGGDGTINETAVGLLGSDTPLGIIPAGSGNGLARHIGIPVDPFDALDVINDRFVRPCDHGSANGHPFFCTFGVGFDAAVSDRFAASPSRGKMTYVKSAVHEFFHYKPLTYTIEADGETITDRALLIAVCNADQYGNNAFIAPDASITDGFLDLVVVHAMPRPLMPLMSVELMAGTLTNRRGIIKRKARNIVIHRDEPGPAHLDGEPFPDAGTDISIRCHPAAINIFANRAKEPFRPLISPAEALIDDMVRKIRHLARPFKG